MGRTGEEPDFFSRLPLRSMFYACSRVSTQTALQCQGRILHVTCEAARKKEPRTAGRRPRAHGHTAHRVEKHRE
jgi:hypothetical protein